jgi:hypothetical protein
MAMLGHKPDIREHDVWHNVSENLSRQPLKASALAALRERAQTQQRGLRI